MKLSINQKILASASVLVLTWGFFASWHIAQAGVVEPGFQVEEVASGLVLPTAVSFSSDGRIFIAEKGGSVRLVKNGSLLSTPVVTLSDVNTFADRGLIGIAVDPNFSTNGYLYLSYTYENSPGINFGGPKTARIVRVTVVGDTALESTKVVLVGSVGGDTASPSCENFPVTADCVPSDSSSHSAGGLKFGPDGFLYASFGDGSDFSNVDPRALRAQNLDSLAGKIIRINPNGQAPSSNPFFDGNPNSNRSKVFAFGVRNSFRLSFHPTTGRLFGGDVGWSSWEEVNRVLPGANLGWPCWEGNSTTTYNCTASGVTLPAYVYAHNASGAGSVTAGAFPDHGAYPSQYNNSLFIGDYAQNWIKYVSFDNNGNLSGVATVIDSAVWPVDIATGLDGSIYYLDIAMGSLNKLTHTTGNRAPVPQIAGTPTSGLTPLQVSFSSAGSNDPDGDPVTYLWNFGDGQTSTLPDPVHTYVSNGSYSAVLTVTDNFGASASKSLTITVGNQAPSPNITAPLSGSLYLPNQIIQLQASATDPEDGQLPESAYSWQIVLHHNTHIHYLQTFTGTSSPSFVADDHQATDVYTEVILTVTDSGGLSSSQSINLYYNNGNGSGNLIANHSVEIPDSNNPNAPASWHQGWFGVLNPIFTYPVTGIEGNSAMKVEVNAYTSGNAKWYFDPVAVSGGQSYNFASKYISDASTEQTVQFGYPNGTYTYQNLAVLPPATTATQVNHTIQVPAGATTMTIFHSLEGLGFLVTDDFSLTLSTPTAPVNLINNGDMDNASAGQPVGWHKGNWGNHTVVFDYPATGFDGGAALGLMITDYPVNGTGDSKWYFDDVPVTSGVEYTFSDRYTSTTISDIIGRYTLADGSFHYFGLVKEIPPSATWQTASKTFVPPANAVSVTFLHLISSVGSLVIDDARLFVSGTGAPADTTAPTVQITSPVEGASVSGLLNITTTATDDTAVAGVYFAIDGISFGSEVTAPPYNIQLDTTTLSNGPHLLKATVHDVFGNNSINTITINVNNTAPPPSVNSIQNPSLETAGTNGDPDKWNRGGWGTNTRVFTYPVAGNSSASAAKVEITSHTSGDAKWYFDDVAVTGGQLYNFSSTYRSNTTSYLTARYTMTGGAVQYAGLGSVPASSVWVPVNLSITPPAGAISLTVFHSLVGVGWLEVDDYALNSGSTDHFTNGLVSLTFDDGWVSHYTDALPILNAEGVKGSFYIISNETADAVPTERIQNPSLETAGTNGDPDKWNRGGWGTNTRVFTYPVVGNSSTSAAKVEITSHTNGDAKWYFDDVLLISGQKYTIAGDYRSNISSELVVRYTLNDSSYQYSFVAGLPSTSGAWQGYSYVVTVPNNAVSATVFHLISQVGELTIDNSSFKRVQVFVDPAQVLAMQSAGHEIGSHTKTHPYLTTLSATQQQDEILGSRNDLLAMGALGVDTFVYPYGDYDASVKTLTQSAGYVGARGVDRGFNLKTTDRYALKIQAVYRDTTLADIQGWLASASANKTWLILMFHQIDLDSSATFGTTPAFLQQIVDEIQTVGLSVVTMREGLGQMNP